MVSIGIISTELNAINTTLCYHYPAVILAVYLEFFMNNIDHPPSMEGEK